jgi:hypothetical protein
LNGSWQANRNPSCFSSAHQILLTKVSGGVPAPPPR